MSFKHACFISFPREGGAATRFAQEFYLCLSEQLAAYGKNELPLFKFDQCESRRRNDDWQRWIADELCHSAMMVAICAPVYFNDAPGCLSEFDGMEILAKQRQACLAGQESHIPDWIIGLRLKAHVALPRLDNNYHVIDFFDCCAAPKQVHSPRHSKKVEHLADRIYAHWQWIKNHENLAKLQQANLCAAFNLAQRIGSGHDVFPFRKVRDE